MKLQANRDQVGTGYKVRKDQVFEVTERSEIDELLRRGLARIPDPPRVVYQTKVIRPAAPEVAASSVFRDVHHADDAQPVTVPPEGDPVLSGTDARAERAADSGRRAGRDRRDTHR